ncbi:type II secretion system protein [Candidatus Gottesmanbacteria bacterium]|nr:type II secretion system protein [Candidatus Gottesmanbacteria bacterium]
MTHDNVIAGFTLIEILVAATIISLLSTIGFISYQATGRIARDAKRKADLQQIRSALEVYKSVNRVYPMTGSNLWYSSESGDDHLPDVVSRADYVPGLEPNYIAKLPKDPKGGISTISTCNDVPPYMRAYLYRSDDGSEYKLLSHCAPEAANWSTNDPYYDLKRGTWAWQVSSGANAYLY